MPKSVPDRNKSRRFYVWRRNLIFAILFLAIVLLAAVVVIVFVPGKRNLRPLSYSDSSSASGAVSESVSQQTTQESSAPPATTEPESTAPLYDELGFTLHTQKAFVADLKTGQVIFTWNADQRTAPASLTKIVTAILVLENCQNLNMKVTASADSIKKITEKKAVTAGIRGGDVYKVKDLLDVMLIRSACDAAEILAKQMGNGDSDAFVAQMNEFVQKIGCVDTHFENPHGLDAEGQYTTAQDMYRIAKYALSVPGFSEIVNKTKGKLPAYGKKEALNYTTTNTLISKSSKYYYKYAKGIKTGSTQDAGRCLITTAEKDGRQVMCVVMGAPFDINDVGDALAAPMIDAKNIFEWLLGKEEISSATSATKKAA